ncbi:MAG: hypothetical protein LQ340_001713 [Diploschistes diacapsis]|nr:MAG: hypothetical protein LQ340_001713 [Diploschistes diacapsis]
MSRLVITDSNRGPLIEVLDWLLLALTVVSVCGREAIKVWVIRKITFDDVFILISMLFSIAQSVTVLVEVANGLGQHQNTLSAEQVDTQQKNVADNYFSVINLLTEVCLIALPCWIVAGLQLSNKRKIKVISTFFGRVPAIIAIICQLVYSNQITTPDDPSFDYWPVVLCEQCIVCLIVVSTCMVYLGPFLDSLESGFMRVDDVRRRGETAANYGSRTGNSSKQHANGPSGSRRNKFLSWNFGGTSRTGTNIELDHGTSTVASTAFGKADMNASQSVTVREI